tara:strand:- start:4759 stop:4914 length:156 start_codon:yes stop_codon:yes gene_type:complete
MARQDKQLNFRIEEDLADWLKQYAKDNRRSISAQLAIILQEEKDRNQEQIF